MVVIIKTALIVSTYNAPEKLSCVLKHISFNCTLPDEIIVADDGSADECKWAIEDWISKLPLKHIWHEDEGFRKCRILNESLKQIDCDYVIFLDGDCLPHRHFVRDHITLAETGFFVQGRRCFIPEKEVASVIGGKKSIKQLILTGKISGYFKSLRFPRPIIIRNMAQRGLIGCNWSAWKKDLIDVNGFDEDYEGWGIGEDSDICSRLYNLGIIRKFVYGRSVVYHMNHPESCKVHLDSSKERLRCTIYSGKTRCMNGLSKFPNCNQHEN